MHLIRFVSFFIPLKNYSSFLEIAMSSLFCGRLRLQSRSRAHSIKIESKLLDLYAKRHCNEKTIRFLFFFSSRIYKNTTNATKSYLWWFNDLYRWFTEKSRVQFNKWLKPEKRLHKMQRRYFVANTNEKKTVEFFLVSSLLSFVIKVNS